MAADARSEPVDRARTRGIVGRSVGGWMLVLAPKWFFSTLLALVSGDKRDAEILALRHQILVLQRQIDRPRFAPAVWKILRAGGRKPTPNRTGPTWSEFIASQAHTPAATVFFCGDTVTLRRFHVLFFIEIGTRRQF